MVKLTGAAVLLRSLELQGVDVVFGIPGGAALPLYDALLDSSIRHVLMRHEQGAGHAAEGYAHVTGRPGVCLVTSGPGGCNLVTALADAMMDSIPLVAITGQVASPGLGRDAFQEAPITAITLPITKQNWLVTDPSDIPTAVQEGFAVAAAGRPGPVLLDVTKDALAAPMDSSAPLSPRAPETADGWGRAELAEAVSLILRSERPIVYAGGGVIRAEASPELLELATVAEIPVVTTLMARGAIPDDHPLSLGMPGMHGSYAAVMAMQRADLLVAVGARFDDRVTGRLEGFAPEAKVVHVDVDPSEIGKNRAADVALLGDAKAVLADLVRLVAEQIRVRGRPDRRAWRGRIGSWARRHPISYRQDPDGPLKPQFVIERLHAATGGDAIVVAGVGQHQMWTSQLWRFAEARRWVNSGGLGTMGFAIPAALGAKAARPDELVLAIDGDGCFQMTCQELATSVTEDLPYIVAVINNASLGMVRQWQEMFHDGRHSAVDLSHDVPDYAALAEAYGCVGLRAQAPEEVDRVIEKALSLRDRTVVVDFRCDPSEMCFPIVPGGASNDEIILDPRVEEGSACS